MDAQKLLLSIVSSWKINPVPEYRGFRCAYCQKYIHKAWFHYLISDAFTCPVHFCKDCEDRFKKRLVNSSSSPDLIGVEKFPMVSSPQVPIISGQGRTIKKIIRTWKNKKPEYKSFSCDLCHKNLFKAYHVWGKMKNTLVELHFCRECWKA